MSIDWIKMFGGIGILQRHPASTYKNFLNWASKITCCPFLQNQKIKLRYWENIVFTENSSCGYLYITKLKSKHFLSFGFWGKKSWHLYCLWRRGSLRSSVGQASHCANGAGLADGTSKNTSETANLKNKLSETCSLVLLNLFKTWIWWSKVGLPH